MNRGAGWRIPPALTGSTSDTGGLVGGTVGANFQTDAFVFGVEGDWDYSAINTGTRCGAALVLPTGNNWLATRAHEWVSQPIAFVHGSAGGAFANIQSTYGGVKSSKTKAGWTAGAGIEWAFADNWTAKVEYLYIDLGTYNGNCSTAAYVGVRVRLAATLQRQPD